MLKWYEKWQYHRKQPAFRSILKFNGLWAGMYLLRIGAFFSWFYWVATTFRYVYQAVYPLPVKGEASEVPDIVSVNSVAVLLVIIVVLLGITAAFTFQLGKGVLLGLTISVIGPLTILSLSVSILGGRWLELSIFFVMLLLLQGTILGIQRYRQAIHMRSHANHKKAILYVTHCLDYVLDQEEGIFPLTEAWAPYMKGESSCMEIGNKEPIVSDAALVNEELGNVQRQVHWTKTYSYTTLSDNLELTASISLLSEMDYLKFVGECIESSRPVIHLGEHVFGVVLSEEDVSTKAFVTVI
ncbi:hypothetical protein [Listeria newyorkensis]|uniref:hypothetical protein n=1 Tax=Listeria newyorkensis TaxID=1497681 RepID=UPI0010F88CC0|nr:hypothetical protein [Listeria newyorkensis]